MEANEINNKLEIKLYCGKKMIFDLEKTKFEKDSWALRKEKYSLTDGRFISLKGQKYFIPDSEFENVH